MNIILTGFMAAGKTEISKAIAAMSSYTLYDTDDMIEKLADNIGKIIATSTAKAENQIKKEIIKNINSLHKRKMLDSIDLLDEVKTIYPRKNES